MRSVSAKTKDSLGLELVRLRRPDEMLGELPHSELYPDQAR
jgi:hypothetical protein